MDSLKRPHRPISIHASAKEATDECLAALNGTKFQSTPPRRRRHCLWNHFINFFLFQSTPPRRRRPGIACEAGICRISIHASAKEATSPGTSRKVITVDFNPRLREGGDVDSEELDAVTEISIHASAKEATIIVGFQSGLIYISIHASAKEATGITSSVQYALEFQSTPPRRRRLHVCIVSKITKIFQSTPPRRRRRLVLDCDYNTCRFQSTPPRRRRLFRGRRT